MIYINYLTVSDNPVITTSELLSNSVGFAIMVNKVYLKNDNKYIVSVTY